MAAEMVTVATSPYTIIVAYSGHSRLKLCTVHNGLKAGQIGHPRGEI